MDHGMSPCFTCKTVKRTYLFRILVIIRSSYKVLDVIQ